jgi:hypothetical protein
LECGSEEGKFRLLVKGAKERILIPNPGQNSRLLAPKQRAVILEKARY